MKKLPKKLLLLSGWATGMLFTACQQEVSPAADLPAISFNQKVMPIIASGCTAAGCHGNENPEEFSLLSYDDVMRHGDVTPGDPRGSKLYKVITKLSGGEAMPPDNPLTDQQIATIYLWILQGAKNN